jgi:hypothetical protein
MFKDIPNNTLTWTFATQLLLAAEFVAKHASPFFGTIHESGGHGFALNALFYCANTLDN